MTIRPGLHFMNGTSGIVPAPLPAGSCQDHGTPQILHTVSPKLNRVEQSKMDSQHIVDAMLVQERQAYAQEGQGAAACSTAPVNQSARADFVGASARREGNGNSGRVSDVAGRDERGDEEEMEARQQLVGLVEELKR